MALMDLILDETCALIIVDMQNDFLPGGSLPVAGGFEIIDEINTLAQKFSKKNLPVIFTQDWHPVNHKSFASAHANKQPGDVYEAPGIGPILWPDHCVQNSLGAQINDKMRLEFGTAIIRKGYHENIDSYSAFYDNDGKTKTGLAGLLRDLDVHTVYVCGLALDYCCYYTALDAVKENFEVVFLKSLTRGIDNPPGSISNAIKEMQNHQVQIS